MKTKLTTLLVIVATKLMAQLPSPVSNPKQFDKAKALNTYLLPIGKNSIKGSYPLAVSDKKTVHIVFPSQIKEVDASNQYVRTEITENFNNVLKIKSICIDDCIQTNLTILTEDGGFYSFLLNYEENPEILNINIAHNSTVDLNVSKDLLINQFVHSKYIDKISNSSTEEIKSHLMLANNQEKNIKNVGIQYMYMTAMLVNLNKANNTMIYTIKLNNTSDIDYKIDFIKMYIRDKTTAKRLAIQEEEVKVLGMYPLSEDLPASTFYNLSIATDVITIADDKIIELEIYEKNGGRHLRFPIDSKIIAKAKKLSK